MISGLTSVRRLAAPVSAPRFNRADGADAMHRLLDRDDPPDAVFCYSDLVALHAALERGVRVPEDIALIGYDDIEEGRYSNPTISTISPDKTTIASTAVSRLLQRIDSTGSLPGIEVRADHRLIARQSTVGRRAGS
jgi:LacI family transcriptional regulator, repressor for deo operon, udp, cdd, tsx, nupC, and nupG